jgi:hypothetical protein
MRSSARPSKRLETARADPLRNARSPIRTGLGFSVAAAACWAGSLFAQTDGQVKEERVWNLQGLRAGYCVRFLIDPKRAAGDVKQGFQLVRADQDTTLHSALQHVIQGQPEFASWVPSTLCFYYTDAVQVGRQRVAERNPRIAQMVGIWTLATVEQSTEARRDIVLDMYASRERLRSAASTNLVPLHEAEVGFTPPNDSSGTEYRQKIGRTQLIWNGRTTGVATSVEDPIVDTGQLSGLRGVTWNVRMALSPARARALVGSLRVEGKGELADRLKESPIRFVGPFYHGGGGEIRFTR